MLKIKSAQARLSFYFILILLPLVVISLFANYQLGHILEKQVGERSGNALVSSMEYVDLTLQSIEEMSAQIATDENILKLLRHDEAEMTPPMLADFQTLIKQLTNLNSNNHAISEISILHSASGLMISTQFGGRRSNDFESQDWFNKAIEARGKTIIYVPDKDEYDINGNLDPVFNTKSISFMRMMDLYGRQDYKNVLAITIRKETLLTFAKNLPTSSGTDISLYTGEGRWLAGTSQQVQQLPEWKNAEAKTMVGNHPDSDQKLFYIKAQSSHSKWLFVMTQPESELNKETLLVRLFTYAIILISVILAMLISWVVYSWITSPLSILSRGMKQFQLGNLDVRLNKQRDDEFGFLMESFNTMAEQHKKFIQDTYEQQLRLAKTELRFIQSQINPHFLYNTLNSIYQLAKNYDAKEISDMVFNLSKFFRLSLNKGTDEFTLEETMEHLSYYIRIQQIRFRERLQVRMEIAENCRSIPIQKLLLQPLVENALHHGIEKQSHPGELVLTASLVDGAMGTRLMVTIQDNGAGISPERMSYIHQELGKLDTHRDDIYRDMEQYTSSPELFGLRNVKVRLKMVYGSQAELLIDSEERLGTTVKILIPVHLEGESKER